MEGKVTLTPEQEDQFKEDVRAQLKENLTYAVIRDKVKDEWSLDEILAVMQKGLERHMREMAEITYTDLTIKQVAAISIYHIIERFLH